MKKLTEYREITPQEGLRMLADHWPEPVPNMAFRAFSEENWDGDEVRCLTGVVGSTFVFVGNDYGYWYSRRYCAQVIERYPRDVPEGVPPLPEDKPWLAYVPKYRIAELKKTGHSGYYGCRKEPDEWVGPCYTSIIDDSFHYAIDCRTEFARVNYPDIVEAMELDE